MRLLHTPFGVLPRPAGGFGASANLTPPNGWRRVLPFRIRKSGSRFSAGGFNLQTTLNIAVSKTYYVSTAGNDGNSGLDWETSLRSIDQALIKPDVDRIYVQAGAYGFTYGWGVTSQTRSVEVIAVGGRVRIGSWAEGLAYTEDSGAWKVTRSNVGNVLDASNLDGSGYYTPLTEKSSAAEVQANANSWHLDGSNVLWVQTFDSREPDWDILAMFSSVTNCGAFLGGDSGNLYCEGLDFEGGWQYTFRVQAAAGPDIPTAGFKNCTFGYSQTGNGFFNNGAITFLEGCIFYQHYDDGISYKTYQGGLPHGVEIDCTSQDNGSAGDIDNGSSMHDGGSVVRINGEYTRNVGPNLHDVGTGSQSWNLGVKAHDSASAVNDKNFAIGTGGSDTAEMWLDGCRSSGSAVDLVEDANAVLKYRNLTSSGNFSGTPITY